MRAELKIIAPKAGKIRPILIKMAALPDFAIIFA